MAVGMRLSAVFVAGPRLINARTISKPVRVYTSSTEMSVCTLNFSICTTDNITVEVVPSQTHTRRADVLVHVVSIPEPSEVSGRQVGHM